jgi:hypothetical protein
VRRFRVPLRLSHVFKAVRMRITVFRLAYGAVLVVAPGVLLRACGGPDDRPARIYARLLGGRQIAEGLVLVGRDEPGWPLAGALVDALHAATAVALAAHSERYRRLALLNAAGASALAMQGIRTALR